jgi:hypothetical protein
MRVLLYTNAEPTNVTFDVPFFKKVINKNYIFFSKCRNTFFIREIQDASDQNISKPIVLPIIPKQGMSLCLFSAKLRL